MQILGMYVSPVQAKLVSLGKNALVLFCADFCPWCKNKLNAPLMTDAELHLQCSMFASVVVPGAR